MRYLFLAFLILNFSALGQSEIERLVRSSEEFERRDRFPEAIELISKAIALEPNNPNLILKRANILYGNGQKDEAISDLLRAADLAPEDGEIVIRSTILLQQFEECASSLRILDRYIAKNSTSAEHFFRRAISRSCLKDPFGASEDLLAAVDLAPTTVAYRAEYLRQLADLGESKRALESLSKLIVLLEKKKGDPKLSSQHSGFKSDLSSLYQTRARLFHAGGDTEKEFLDLGRYVEFQPTFYNYQNRARIYLDHQMYKEGIADFTESIRLTTDHPPIAQLVERAEAYVLAEKHAEAVADYEAALKLQGVVNRNMLEQRLMEIRKMIGNPESPIN